MHAVRAGSDGVGACAPRFRSRRGRLFPSRPCIRARSHTELAALSALNLLDTIPPELDRILLPGGADVLGRYLDSPERHHLRQTARRLATKGHPRADETRRPDATGETEADRIRRFASETIIEPARLQGRTTISIRAGDVAGSMELQHNTPNVVTVLRGRKFEKLAGVTVTDRTGPEQGPNTEFTYAIDVSPRIPSDLKSQQEHCATVP